VIGELAIAILARRDLMLSSLRRLPKANVARDDEVMRFVDRETLRGIGIGYIDAHLLASTRLTEGATFWTRDRRLHAAAERLSLAARLFH
jgi:predicted nucleic acid-binding protein